MRTAVLALLAAGFVATACTKKAAPSCEAAVAHLDELARKGGSEVPAEAIAQLIQVCVDQTWSDATRRCVAGADTPAAAQACLHDP